MLLKLLTLDYIFFLPLIVTLINYWVIFFKNNISVINKKNNWDKSISIKNIIINQSPIFLIKLNSLFLILLIFYLNVYSGFNSNFWWSHFKITNFNLNIYLLILIVNVFFLYIANKHVRLNNVYSIDYIFSVSNITLFIPILFISNTLFTFFFFIEIVSCCILYKFILSKFNFNTVNSKDNFFSVFSKNYLNVLFYQYWSSFFSSILIVFSMYNLFSIIGSTEWSIINFILKSNCQINYLTNYAYIVVSSILLFIGFLIKLGIAPIQLYKIEVYKGLPFLSIFFYTTFYFLIFFLYFTLIFIYYLSSLVSTFWILLFIIIFFGIFYIISILFDLNFFKAFLAYSTIINSVSFMILILAIIL